LFSVSKIQEHAGRTFTVFTESVARRFIGNRRAVDGQVHTASVEEAVYLMADND
jgi:hypothetical protein